MKFYVDAGKPIIGGDDHYLKLKPFLSEVNTL